MKGPELEFLPAAMEVEETPPAPLGRAVLWVIVSFFTLAVVWAVVGRVDVVATAPGKIVPSGRVKRIQPLEIGVIRRIHVREGQRVAAGERLIELDATVMRAEQERLARELSAATVELARLRVLAGRLEGDGLPLSAAAARAAIAAELEGTRAPPRPVAGMAAADPPVDQSRLVRIHAAILRNELSAVHARGLALDHEADQRRAEQARARVLVAKLEETLPLVSRRVDALASLARRKMVGELTYLELVERQIGQRRDLEAQRGRLAETVAAVAALRARRIMEVAESRRAVYSEIERAEGRVHGLIRELVTARERTQRRRLTAPVAGFVQRLSVHTVGGVVTPAQPLMLIVPGGRDLEIEAWLPNQDVGFVHEGQAAAVKVRTFPFTRYGTVEAEVAALSSDAVAKEDLGLVYAMRVVMRRSAIVVGEKLAELSPGMAVTVEVKTGKRRLIEFLLSPLLRGLRESARER